MAEAKTNAVRILDKAGIRHEIHNYENDGHIDGLAVAQKMGQDPARVFKTLVTQGKTRAFYVFVIPVAEELDLKKAAASVGEKSVEMIAVKDLLKTTGYIRGGCSPIGMKKPFPTVIDENVLLQDTIYISAGRIGTQIEIAPDDLLSLIGAKCLPIIK